MTILIDTNVLGRLAHPADPHHTAALDSVVTARRRGYRPAIVPQVLYEFWVVATRPYDQNGLGMSIPEAERDLAICVQKFELLRDERAIFDHWRELVVRHKVHGKNAHDARLVAAMKRHRIKHLLTFDDKDFLRFPDITVVNPAEASSLPNLL